MIRQLRNIASDLRTVARDIWDQPEPSEDAIRLSTKVERIAERIDDLSLIRLERKVRRAVYSTADRFPGAGFEVFGIPVRLNRGGNWLHLLETGPRIARFKKQPKPGIYIPERWGFMVLGLEVGSRG